MSLPEGSVINTANSYLEYKVKFTFNYKASAWGGNETTYAEQVVPTDPEAATDLPVGRYTVLDTGLWCEPAKVNSNGKFKEFGTPKWICQFPMNSSVILNQTTVQYGNITQTDD